MSLIWAVGVGFACPKAAMAEGEDPIEARRLSEITVTADTEVERPLLDLPETADGKIFSGKQGTVTDIDEKPEIPNQNYRQLFNEIPGLTVAEVSNESFLSTSYRGIGDPHESFNVNVLKDGIPINADLFGYPAVYYQPPAQSVERIEFVHGGSALLYGPQVSGALNFITRSPDTVSPTGIRTEHIGGSYGLYSTYNEVTTSAGGIGFLGSYNFRRSDGFRDENSDYRVHNAVAKAAFETAGGTDVLVELNAYDADHGEAGGLTLERGEGLANYDDDREQSTLEHDRLRIERYMPSLNVSHKLDGDTEIIAKAWGGYYSRYSKRQSAGDAPAFGGVAVGTTNTIQKQEFRTGGGEARLLHDYEAFGNEHTVSTGLFLLGTDSPFRVEKGSTPFANTGSLERLVERDTFVGSVFAENRFNFGDLAFTPGFRLENIYQKIDERFNVSDSDSLRETDSTDTVPLLGAGVEYKLPGESIVHANVSQGYRPVTYQDAVPLSSGDVISDDLEESESVSYEAGFRGTPLEWWSWRASYFFVEFDDQFGRVENQIQNVGRAEYQGVELASAVDLFGIAENDAGTLGSLRLHANVTFLDAEFTRGPVDGKTPQYAPDYLLRTGLSYESPQGVKVALLGTLVDETFADDANTANRFVPSYKVWDLLAEVPVYGDIRLVAGINNLFDEEYYSRIRSNGIEPAAERNYYAGVDFRF